LAKWPAEFGKIYHGKLRCKYYR